MGDRNAGEERRRDGARDAGNDFAGNAGCGQRERFLPAPAEDERIPAFQPNDPMTTGIYYFPIFI